MEIRYALIKNGIVENYIIADAEFIATIADQYDHCELLDTPEEQKVTGLGWTWDGTNFIAPIQEVIPVLPIRILTKVEYLKRFSQSERISIREAAKLSPIIEDYVELLNLSTEINLDDPETIAGVNALETNSLISSGRATEILA